MSMFKVHGFNHTAFVVRDLDRTIGFFRDMLGLELISRAPRDGKIIGAMTDLADIDIEIAHLDGFGHRIELILYKAPADRGGDMPKIVQDGSGHIALDVDDPEAAVDAAAAYGLKPVGKIVTIDAGRTRGERSSICRARTVCPSNSSRHRAARRRADHWRLIATCRQQLGEEWMPALIDLTMPICRSLSLAGGTTLDQRSRARRPVPGHLAGLCRPWFHPHGQPAPFLSADGKTTDDIALEQTVGPADVIDLLGIEPNTAIDAAMLEAAGAHVASGEIIVFKTGWGEQRSVATPEFWLDAPYLERSAAEWLLARSPKAVAFDFPQDYCIRLLLSGEIRPIEEHVSHDVLLRNDVVLIEYLTNTQALTTKRVSFTCLPIKLPAADGAPARVVAKVV